MPKNIFLCRSIKRQVHVHLNSDFLLENLLQSFLLSNHFYFADSLLRKAYSSQAFLEPRATNSKNFGIKAGKESLMHKTSVGRKVAHSFQSTNLPQRKGQNAAETSLQANTPDRKRAQASKSIKVFQKMRRKRKPEKPKGVIGALHKYNWGDEALLEGDNQTVEALLEGDNQTVEGRNHLTRTHGLLKPRLLGKDPRHRITLARRKELGIPDDRGMVFEQDNVSTGFTSLWK